MGNMKQQLTDNNSIVIHILAENSCRFWTIHLKLNNVQEKLNLNVQIIANS